MVIYLSSLDARCAASFPVPLVRRIPASMSDATIPVQLTTEDVAYLLMVLRNASAPLSTAELIEALRQRAGA